MAINGKTNPNDILQQAARAVDEMKATALKLSEQARQLAKMSREATETLEATADQLATTTVKIFDEFGAEAMERVDRTAAAIKAVQEHGDLITKPLALPEHSALAVTPTGETAFRALEQALLPEDKAN